jgi:tRNA(Leu) C34 or U34 (ribose-2'-O)-methylase TrmL
VFKILFHSLQIAPNTGNAIRMVAATGCELHLVEQAMKIPRDLADAGHVALALIGG